MMPLRFLRSAVVWLPLAAILAYCAFRAFPVYDDGYLLLLIQEAGVGGIAAAHPDRPVFGLLLEFCARVGGTSPVTYIVVSILGWLGLAVEASLLWQTLFPTSPDFGPVVGALCLSPVFVQTQFTTVTVALIAGLAINLSLAGLLIVLDDRTESFSILRVAAASVLTVAGALVSEYGVFTSLAGAALLLVLRRLRATALLTAVAGIGYGIFRATGRADFRTELHPAIVGVMALKRPLEGLLREVSGAWTASGGAIVRALGSIRIEMGSRSTLLAAASGTAMGVLVYVTERRPAEQSTAQPETRKLWALLAAIAVGVLPGVLLARPMDAVGFPSRLRMPALAFGAVFIMGLLSIGVIPKWRSAAVCILVFLTGYQTIIGGADALRTRDTLAEMGRRLRPFVEGTRGLVVVVMQDQLGGQGFFPTIAKATLDWPPSLSRRVWVVSPMTASRIAGVGAGCRPPETVNLVRGLRVTPLTGPLGALLSIDVRHGQPGEIVPYCGPAGRSP
jgi:hypothetical protein